MTVESAAETLMVSPGFLVGLLERGAIPFDRTRTGYSLQASDIEDFQAVLRKRQDAFLAELDAEIED
jgi:excisionase family DNA binding protein